MDLQLLADAIQELKNKRPCAACDSNGAKHGRLGQGENCPVCQGTGTTQLTIDQQFLIYAGKATPGSFPSTSSSSSPPRQKALDEEFLFTMNSNANNNTNMTSPVSISSLIQEVNRLKARRHCAACKNTGCLHGRLSSHEPCDVCGNTDHPGYSENHIDQDRKVYMETAMARIKQDSCCVCVVQ